MDPSHPFLKETHATGMELTLNNVLKQVDANPLSLQQLADLELPDKQKGLAIAVNQHVIPKKDWVSFLLKPNDSILFIKATQGG